MVHFAAAIYIFRFLGLEVSWCDILIVVVSALLMVLFVVEISLESAKLLKIDTGRAAMPPGMGPPDTT